MKHFHFKTWIFLSSLLALFLCVNAQAAETTTTTTTTSLTPEGDVVKEITKTTKIITPVPAPKEVVAAPSGYVVCFKVEAEWFNGVWVPTHQVCQYENTGEGVVWVEGYWACKKATPEGVCSNWEWRSGRWEKKLVVY